MGLCFSTLFPRRWCRRGRATTDGQYLYNAGNCSSDWEYPTHPTANLTIGDPKKCGYRVQSIDVIGNYLNDYYSSDVGGSNVTTTLIPPTPSLNE